MNFRKLNENDTEQFSLLIKNMYEHLTNLEWFSPMPFDSANVNGMITSPRFYILGAFDNDKLVGVSSLDYKCGKLIGKIDFPSDCNTDKLVEIGFNIVDFEYRGNKIMQSLIDKLLVKIKDDGFEYVFSKVHKDNFASSKSFYNKGFNLLCAYSKPIKKNDFINLSSQDFFCKEGKINADKTLLKFKNEEIIETEYNIYIKKLST